VRAGRPPLKHIVRDKRILLHLKQETYDAICRLAYSDNRSATDLINSILDDFINEKRELHGVD